MQEERFDHVLKEMLDAHVQARRYAGLIDGNVRSFRRQAYRFARHLLNIRKHYHNEFVNWVRVTNFGLDQWLDDHFAVIESLGETRQRLMAAIESGITEQEYVRRGANVYLVSRRLRTSDATSKPTPEPQPAEPLTEEEALAHFTDLCKSYKSQVQALRSENHKLRADLAQTLRENERVNKAIKRVEKMLAKVHGETATS